MREAIESLLFLFIVFLFLAGYYQFIVFDNLQDKPRDTLSLIEETCYLENSFPLLGKYIKDDFSEDFSFFCLKEQLQDGNYNLNKYLFSDKEGYAKHRDMTIDRNVRRDKVEKISQKELDEILSNTRNFTGRNLSKITSKLYPLSKDTYGPGFREDILNKKISLDEEYPKFNLETKSIDILYVAKSGKRYKQSFTIKQKETSEEEIQK